MGVRYLIGTAIACLVRRDAREFLQRNGVAFQWVDVEHDPLVRLPIGSREFDQLALPCILCDDGSMLRPPPRYVPVSVFQRFQSERPGAEERRAYLETSRWRSELSERAGLPHPTAARGVRRARARCRPGRADGRALCGVRGPARGCPRGARAGRSGGTSSRIENYPGFPEGVSGAELAESTYEQAVRLGAEILVGVELQHVTTRRGGLARTSPISARASNRSTGHWQGSLDQRRGLSDAQRHGRNRRLLPPARGRGSRRADRRRCLLRILSERGTALSRRRVFFAVVAPPGHALHLAEFARRVTTVVRGDSLAKAMSNYPVERIHAHPRITVRTGSNVRSPSWGRPPRNRAHRRRQDSRRRNTSCARMHQPGLAANHSLPASRDRLRRDQRGFLMKPDLLKAGRRPLVADRTRAHVPRQAKRARRLRRRRRPPRLDQSRRVSSRRGAMALALIHRYLSTLDVDPGQPG